MKSRLKAIPQTKRDLFMGVFTLGIILIASFFASDSVVDFLCRMVIYMLFASACNIILGFGGLRPLGQGTYFGFAAYAYLFMIVRLQWPVGLALPMALLCSVGLSALVGFLCLRANDDMAFAFMNMGINTMLFTMVQKLQIVGSDTGITGASRLPFATSTRANFYFCLVVVAVCILVIWLFYRSPFASVLKGSRENLERLTFLGYNTRNIRLVAYIISGLFCSIAGLLYSMRNMGAFPTMISPNTSLDALIMCLIGGMNSFFGPILGAAVMTVINVQLPIYTQYYQAILGVIIVLCVLFLQGGMLHDKTTRDIDGGDKKNGGKKKPIQVGGVQK
ncbi:MAG: branched-chain amino acid ABC transporter permease [Oscillospiraceae bacterium]